MFLSYNYFISRLCLKPTIYTKLYNRALKKGCGGFILIATSKSLGTPQLILREGGPEGHKRCDTLSQDIMSR